MLTEGTTVSSEMRTSTANIIKQKFIKRSSLLKATYEAVKKDTKAADGIGWLMKEIEEIVALRSLITNVQSQIDKKHEQILEKLSEEGKSYAQGEKS